jgi:hypothetical protein
LVREILPAICQARSAVPFSLVLLFARLDVEHATRSREQSRIQPIPPDAADLASTVCNQRFRLTEFIEAVRATDCGKDAAAVRKIKARPTCSRERVPSRISAGAIVVSGGAIRCQNAAASCEAMSSTNSRTVRAHIRIKGAKYLCATVHIDYQLDT